VSGRKGEAIRVMVFSPRWRLITRGGGPVRGLPLRVIAPEEMLLSMSTGPSATGVGLGVGLELWETPGAV
jgi:hypothetical protein